MAKNSFRRDMIPSQVTNYSVTGVRIKKKKKNILLRFCVARKIWEKYPDSNERNEPISFETLSYKS